MKSFYVFDAKSFHVQSFVGSENACVDYCENGAICQTDSQQHPICICSGDWTGPKCNTPPDCHIRCGNCARGSSINECL